MGPAPESVKSAVFNNSEQKRGESAGRIVTSEPMTAHSHHGFLQNVLTIRFAQSLRGGNSQYRFRVQAVELFPIRITGTLFESRHQAVLSSNHV
jgi:hypothetical protein